ncbi:hypothetical protein ACFXAZ_18220 [Streptomyces sp. NPDC059477]|uniref:hypothetical protein n=1 Tax=Streptomyces sp. NPDC059477 TaxID=3346847 RepID=UPI0036CAFC90
MPARTDVCGLWLRLQDAPVDLIFSTEGTTSFHRQRIILHELAHLWCDDVTEVGIEQLADLLPDVPPEELRRLGRSARIAARHRYDSAAERRAEALADLLHQEAHRTDHIDDATLGHLDEDLTYLFRRASALRKPARVRR